MDLLEIIRKLAPYIFTALLLIIFVVSVSLLLYFSYRKKGGKKVISVPQFLGAYLLVGWLVVVIGLTIFSRGGGYEGWFNFRIFSGYISAWNNWSLNEFQLIIFNMLMFLPLGFLLPVLSRRFRSFGKVLLISLIITIAIEIFQMLTQRGIFELDDIFHNTLGSITGYFIMMAILICGEKRRITLVPVLKAFAIPMCFLLFFLGAIIIYQTKELGNMPILPAIPQKMNGVEVELSTVLPDTSESVPMYYNRLISNIKYAKEMIRILEDSFELNQKSGLRIDGSNRVVLFKDKIGNDFYFTYSLSNGSWSLLHINDSYHSINYDKLSNLSDYYEKWLMDNNLMPQGANFSIQDKTTLRWDAGKEENITESKADYSSGQIMIDFSIDIEIPSSIFYDIAENKYIRDVETISPSKAYENIVQGNFELYNDLIKGDSLNITGYELIYVYDTKGYYRPAYRFEGMRNSEPWSGTVSAMTK